MRLVLAALILVAPCTAGSARGLPPPVAAAVAQAKDACRGAKPARFTPGFITRRDVNGDGVPDFILAWDGIRCGDRGVFCGTGGCRTMVFASSKDGFVEVLDTFAYDLAVRVLNGRPALVLDDFGPKCGPSGQEPCGTILYWTGTEFRAGSEAP